MNINELLSQLPTDVMVEFTGLAAGVDYNPAATWVSRILLRELAQRRDEPMQPIPALQLDETELDFALHWLRQAALRFGDAGQANGHNGLLLMGALLNHVHQVVELKSGASLH